MPWWGWMIIGLVLFGSELMFVDAAFFLVFIGIAAILTGLIEILGFTLAPATQWIIFSVLSIVSMVLFRKRLYQKLRVTQSDYADGLGGETIRLQEALEPGATCRQPFRGTTWTISNEGTARIEAGASVQIVRTDGLEIIVRGE